MDQEMETKEMDELYTLDKIENLKGHGSDRSLGGVWSTWLPPCCHGYSHPLTCLSPSAHEA